MDAGAPGSLFQLLAERYVDPLFYATDGVVQWIAPSVESALGWAPEEMRSLPLISFVHPDDVRGMEHLLSGVDQGHSGRGVFRLRARDGEYLWVLVTLGATSEAHDRPNGRSVGSIREINLRVGAERLLHHVVEQTRDVLVTIGLDRRVVWVSPAVTRILQWEPDELIGSILLDLLHSDDRALVAHSPLSDAPAGPWRTQLDPVHVRLRDRSGAFHWMRLTAAPRRAGDGSVEGVIVGLQDVDELVRARDRITADAERLRLILDSLPDVHGVLSPERDSTGRIVDFTFSSINESGSRHAGRARDEIIGQRLSSVMTGFVASGLLAQLVAVMESGETLVTDDFAYHAGDSQGGIAHFSIRAARVGDSLSVLWRDVTAQRHAAEALADSEEQFRLLAENATDVVLRLRDDVILWASRSLTDALGWAVEDWIGRDVHDFYHADDLPPHRRVHDQLGAGDKVTYRARLRAKDLTYHWANHADGPFIDARGNVDGVVKSFRLIDNEVAAEAALERRARHDDLTGLSNRKEALERLAAMTGRPRQPGGRIGILFCDVDHFKSINDTYGHAAGDTVLRALALRVSGAIRAGDTAARVGGDEMLAILEDVHDMDDAIGVAEKIRRAASLPVPVPGNLVTASMSIGVTLASPGESTDDLVARADEAMYRAKKAGRNQVFALDGSRT